MALIFRPVRITDIEALFDVRAATRDFPLSRANLASIGITAESTVADLSNGKATGWICADDSRVVAFCLGDLATGEVLVLAVLPEYEGRGIGRTLLLSVVEGLRAAGHARLWLAASSNPAVRAHGFYRRLGWKPTNARAPNGDDILELI